MGVKKFVADAFFLHEIKKESKDTEYTPIDLVERIEDILGKDYTEYPKISCAMTIGDPGRIQFMKREDDGIVQMQFLRLRELLPAEIAKDNGDIEVLKLEDGEYLAESASALYDPLTKILLKQESFHGASTAFVKGYLWSLFMAHGDERFYDLAVAMRGTIGLGKIMGKKIKKFEAQVVYEGEALNLTEDMKSFAKYRPATAKIEVRAKRGKSAGLHKDEVIAQIHELRSSSATKKLTVSVIDEAEKTTKIDLLSDRLRIDFELPDITRNHPARHDLIYPMLKAKYKELVMGDDIEYLKPRKDWILKNGAKT